MEISVVDSGSVAQYQTYSLSDGSLVVSPTSCLSPAIYRFFLSFFDIFNQIAENFDLLDSPEQIKICLEDIEDEEERESVKQTLEISKKAVIEELSRKIFHPQPGEASIEQSLIEVSALRKAFRQTFSMRVGENHDLSLKRTHYFFHNFSL